MRYWPAKLLGGGPWSLSGLRANEMIASLSLWTPATRSGTKPAQAAVGWTTGLAAMVSNDARQPSLSAGIRKARWSVRADLFGR